MATEKISERSNQTNIYDCINNLFCLLFNPLSLFFYTMILISYFMWRTI